MVSDSKQTLLIVFGAVACVLLIACANLAGLLLTQHTGAPEGNRNPHGAWRHSRAHFGPVANRVSVAFCNRGVAGIVLSTWLARVIVSMQAGDIPRLDSVSPDTNVLLFGLGLSALTSILFGLLPVLQFSRTSVIDTLRKSSRESDAAGFPLHRGICCWLARSG